jgi:hypothetical protein
MQRVNLIDDPHLIYLGQVLLIHLSMSHTSQGAITKSREGVKQKKEISSLRAGFPPDPTNQKVELR